MIESINAVNAPKAVGSYVHAVKAGEFVYTSGQLGLDPVSGELADGVAKQAQVALDNLQEVLHAAGASLETVVKTTVYLTDMNDFTVVNEIYAKYFQKHKPARSCVGVAALPKGGLVEIEAIAMQN